ncbi:hypothetical protein N9470_03330 [Emcibacteraceae bacterium]|nr:hypothetical protein [Emcibacteraceae bacterium]
MDNKIIKAGLWAKATAYAEGNEDKTKALYIKYRVQFLIDSVNSGDYYFYNKDKSEGVIPVRAIIVLICIVSAFFLFNL